MRTEIVSTSETTTDVTATRDSSSAPTRSLAKTLMNAARTFAATVTAETPPDHTSANVTKVSSSTATFVKIRTSAFPTPAHALNVSTLPEVTSVSAAKAKNSEQTCTHAMTPRKWHVAGRNTMTVNAAVQWAIS